MGERRSGGAETKMETIKLQAEKRTVVGKHVKTLRRQGLLPAVVYGAGIEATPIQLNARETAKVLDAISGSTLVELDLGKEKYQVLVRDVQREVIHREPLHVDFLKVAMDVLIRATVPVELVGEAPVVRDLAGVLVTGLTEVEVEALPADLPDRVTVDLEALEDFDSSINVSDLVFGKNVQLITDPEELIARAVHQRVEEEIEEEEVEELGLEEPEVVERGAREAEEAGEEKAGESE